MWGAPAPACGPGNRRRCRKCLVIDSRTFKYPPCNKNRLPAGQPPRPLPARGGGARTGRAERSRPPPGPRSRPPPGPEVARKAPDRSGALHLAGAAVRRTKRCGGEGWAGRRGEGSCGSAPAVRPRSRAWLSSLALGACGREPVVVWGFCWGGILPPLLVFKKTKMLVKSRLRI